MTNRVVGTSIVIPTRRRAACLRRTLDSLEQQTDKDFEVIVVCDGPDPETQALAQHFCSSYPLRWEVHRENRGIGAARNTGVAAARGDLVLFLDDDTVPTPEWSGMHRRRHGVGDKSVVLGRLENVYAKPARSAAEHFVRRVNDRCFAELWRKLERMEPGSEAEFWVGLNSSLSRRAYLDAGGCDPELAIQEEANLAVRLLQRGFTFMFEPGILLYHHDPKDVVLDRELRAMAFGRSDIYRARNENAVWALSPMLRFLAAGAPLLRQGRELFCWYFPSAARVIAEACRVAGEATAGDLLLKVWGTLIFSAGYWEGVRSQGVASPAAVRQLIADISTGQARHGRAPTTRVGKG